MVNNAADYKEDVSKPSFVSQKIFSKNFIATHEIKPVLRLEKTIYRILYSQFKHMMYEFHCKYIKSKLNAK